MTDSFDRVRAAVDGQLGEQFFRAVVDATPVPLAITRESDGLVLYANPLMCELFGASVDTILDSKTFDRYLSRRDRQGMISEFIERGSLRDYEVEMKRFDGTLFWGSISAELLTFDRERCLYVSAKDITTSRAPERVLKESEERYQLLVEASQVIAWEMDLGSGRFTYVGPRSEEILGYPREQWYQENFWRDHIHPDDFVEANAFCEAATAQGEDHEFDYRMIAADGRTVWIHDLVSVITKEGKPVALRGVMVDITDRKRAEDAQRASDIKLREMTDALPLLLAHVDCNQKYLFANRTYEEWFALTRGDIEGKTVREVVGAERYERIKEKIDLVLSGRKSTFEAELAHRIEGMQIVKADYIPAYDGDGTVNGFYVVVRDITERKHAEAELQKNKQRLQDILDSLFVFVGLYSTDGILIDANRAPLEAAGLKREEVIGKLFWETYWWSYSSEVQDQLREALRRAAAGETVRYDVPVRVADGILITIDVTFGPLYDSDGRVVQLIGSAVDITERKRTEIALRTSEERLDLAMSAAELAVWDWNVKTGRIHIDEQWAKILGYELKEIQADSAGWKKILHPEDAPSATARLDLILAGEMIPYEAEYRIRTRQKTWKWISTLGKVVEREADGTPSRIIGIHRDIDAQKLAEQERRRLEVEVQSDQKLKSLGLMAGGIAHDFNNLLVGVLGHAELAREDLPESTQAAQNVAKIETAAERAAELCHQLLAYSGRGRFVVEVLDLNCIVRDTIDLLETTIHDQTRLTFQLSDDAPVIKADAAQISRILMNLITNASEAIGENEGDITVCTGLLDADRAYLSSTFVDDNLPAGAYAFVEVTDTGVGMDEETVAKMFDPFFSSKFTGRGLGLAAVQGIVRGHSGAIKVDSRPDQGTSIRILLPAHLHSQPVERSPRSDKTSTEHSGTILVVDDTDIVRTVTQRTLERAGFQVITASDGREALECFAAHRDIITAVILDLVMPNLDGDQTFHELKRMRIDVPVLLTSGYDEQETTDRLSSKGLAGFLQKPFRPQILVQKLNELLSDS